MTLTCSGILSGSLVAYHAPAGGRHCIHGGRKECPDVGFQKRGSGKEACALLAKLVT